MRHKFYSLLFLLSVAAHFDSAGQAPSTPITPAPSHQSTTTSNDVNMCATVSDPNGDMMTVRYFGRKKSTSSSQKFTLVFLPDTQYYTEEPHGVHGGNIDMFNAQT